MEEIGDILPARQFGEILGIPHIEVIRRIRRGDIQAKKLGWNWVIELAEVAKVRESDWYKRRLAKQRQQTSLS